MSNSVRPHRQQPTRLPRPWDSPGKNTGVGCHFLLQCMKVKSESEVIQSCPTLCNPTDGRPPGCPVPGILQARTLEWVAISFSRGSSRPRDRTRVSRIAGMLLLLLSLFSRVRLCATPETAAHQTPPSLGFSRQEYWSGLPKE